MMWKRSIVQAETRGLLLALASFAVVSSMWGPALGADLVIEIPGSGSAAAAAGGRYRLDYRPAHGSPAPNFTVPAEPSTIKFQGRPGTKYHFMLYYSNDTFADLLTWNQTIITAPEPPTNLTVTLGRGKQAAISWAPPAHGDYTGFRFKVIALTERAEVSERNITVAAGTGNWTRALRDLAPGATYQLHAFTLLHDKESAAYASRNFTTKPNTPGKFIVWFRNETTLLVLWQPPYPPGFYTHYKVSIVPPDARDSELYVEKEGEPPGPAQAAFKGLVPGRAYNISVQTVSEPEISAPTTAQYRTVPLRPTNVTALQHSLTETSFQVAWLPPADESEFEKYQVAVSGETRRLAPLVRARSDPPLASFDSLEPGAHYTVTVKTMSGKVTSWPAATELTLKPLPVERLQGARAGGGSGGAALQVWWRPAELSTQTEYRVEYHEAGPGREDAASMSVTSTNVTLESLLAGRNYTVSVSAVSRGAVSNATSVWVATRPLAPVVVAAEAGAGSLRLTWRSDVTSRQDAYRLRYRRHEPGTSTSAYREVETRDTSALLEGLFPGAVYELRVAALSHHLYSDENALYKPVRPLPATSVSVSVSSSDSARVQWVGPARAAGALSHYSLRYRPEEAPPATAPAWLTLPPIDAALSEVEISNLTHGERYVIELDTLSEEARAPGEGGAVPSGQPRVALHTVRPDPVSNVAQLVDTRNLTLEWPRAAGRVHSYTVRWRARDSSSPHDHHEREWQWEQEVKAGEGEGAVRALLGGLDPGEGYSIEIAAISYNLTSDLFTMDTRTRPLIQSEMTIVNEADSGDDNETLPSILVTYTPTPASATRFDSYRFRLEPAEGEVDGGGSSGVQEARRAAGGDEPRRVLFPALEPGALYNVTMWTVSHNVTSHPVQRQARLYPRAVGALHATGVLARSVTLAWPRPPGVATDYRVQYLAAADTLRTHYSVEPRLTLHELRPHTNYTFTVVVRAGGEGALRTVSRAVSLVVGTAQAPPPPPSRFRPLDAKPASLALAWDLPPEEANGELVRFLLDYWPQSEPGARTRLTFPAEVRKAVVDHLTPGATYELELRGETRGGAGEPARWTQHMAIGAPPRPPASALPAPAAATPTTVAVRFRSDYFSPANGNVTAYTLVVAEEPTSTATAGGGARMLSWRDVQRLPVWPPYQVTEPYYPFRLSPVEQFTVGSERCEAGARRYCNGPLKPSTKYYVKLRAFTAPDKYTDTAYTTVHTEADNTGWIVGGCVALGVVAACVAVAVAVRRRRGTGGGTGRARSAAAPQPRTSRPVRVSDFIDHYRLMAADSDFRFSEEFEELKHVGRDQPTTAADLPVNRPKNRFTNILPYDHSRYKLRPVDDEEGSDYINANYVPGHNSPREFIVTQGPLHATRDDFWRMCWESGARGIVMLTRCVEKGREKCDRYWPYDTRPVYYGDIAVTALNESRYPDWTVTELMVARGSEQRVVNHLHFTTWPDFGVPEPPETLARFVRAFRDRCPAEPGHRPVLVHCSAGVGRSGTFITLDTALQRLARGDDHLDVFGMVHALRRERVWMVQTEQQYICIHQCLVAALEGDDLQPPEPHHLHHHNPAFEDDEGIAESGM